VAEVQALQGADERKVVLQLNHHFWQFQGMGFQCLKVGTDKQGH
jgi:hypothetical protein